MPVDFYRLLHLFGIFLLMLTFGGIGVHLMNGGPKAFPHRKFLAAMHGIALVVILIAGFGMLAKLGLMQGGMPGWVVAKLVIWLVLGGLPALFYRKPQLAKSLWFTVLILGGVAAWLALFKPF